MVLIHFQNQEDTDYVFALLQKSALDSSSLEKSDLVLIVDVNEKQSTVVLQQILKKFILDKKRIDLWKQILQDEFYYTDEDEQQHIIEMALSILDGKRNDLAIEINHLQDEKFIEEALMDVLLTSHSFSADAIITFRLRSYFEKLPSYLEIAIDEYKLEQEYQMFVHYLRDFLKGRTAQMKCIYIVNEDGFIFFDENKQEMKRSELNKRIDRKLLSNHPVYVDSTTIAPLISIAPEKIFLYTHSPEQGIIQTLKLVFEERLQIEKLENFLGAKTY